MPFMQAVEASDGQMILRKGDPADRLFYIDEGCVVIAEIGKVLKAGDIFGEIWLFSEGTVRMATVRALGCVRMCEIDQATVLRLYREHPEFGFALTRLVTDRLVENQNRFLNELAALDKVDRPALALLWGGVALTRRGLADAGRVATGRVPLRPASRVLWL